MDSEDEFKYKKGDISQRSGKKKTLVSKLTSSSKRKSNKISNFDFDNNNKTVSRPVKPKSSTYTFNSTVSPFRSNLNSNSDSDGSELEPVEDRKNLSKISTYQAIDSYDSDNDKTQRPFMKSKKSFNSNQNQSDNYSNRKFHANSPLPFNMDDYLPEKHFTDINSQTFKKEAALINYNKNNNINKRLTSLPRNNDDDTHNMRASPRLTSSSVQLFNNSNLAKDGFIPPKHNNRPTIFPTNSSLTTAMNKIVPETEADENPSDNSNKTDNEHKYASGYITNDKTTTKRNLWTSAPDVNKIPNLKSQNKLTNKMDASNLNGFKNLSLGVNKNYSALIKSSTGEFYNRAKEETPGKKGLSDCSGYSNSSLSNVDPDKLRNRSYLVGSSNVGNLGMEELMKLFPDQCLKVFVTTWNTYAAKITGMGSLNDLLIPASMPTMADVYVIGTQELALDKQEWNVKIQETLGPHFVLTQSVQHGTLHLSIFIRRDLIWHMSVYEESNVTTRIGPSSIKTKGATSVCFFLFGSSFLFINSHFKAHEGRYEERVEDYKKIIIGLNLPKILKTYSYTDSDIDSTCLFDFVFWFGDLNSRLEMDLEKIGLDSIPDRESDTDNINVKSLIQSKVQALLQFDELNRLITQDIAFTEFREGRILFLPTYKFDVGTNNYDTSKKKRKPGYTDRIMYKCRKKNTATCLQYDSVTSYLESDHKPVYGLFEVKLRPGIDSIPLSGGQYNKEVWLEGLQRRCKTQAFGVTDNTNSKICRIM